MHTHSLLSLIFLCVLTLLHREWEWKQDFAVGSKLTNSSSRRNAAIDDDADTDSYVPKRNCPHSKLGQGNKLCCSYKFFSPLTIQRTACCMPPIVQYSRHRLISPAFLKVSFHKKSWEIWLIIRASLLTEVYCMCMYVHRTIEVTAYGGSHYSG